MIINVTDRRGPDMSASQPTQRSTGEAVKVRDRTLKAGGNTVHVVLVHWRIKPDGESINAFLKDWREVYTIGDRSGLIAEFLSECLSAKEFPELLGI